MSLIVRFALSWIVLSTVATIAVLASFGPAAALAMAGISAVGATALLGFVAYRLHQLEKAVITTANRMAAEEQASRAKALQNRIERLKVQYGDRWGEHIRETVTVHPAEKSLARSA